MATLAPSLQRDWDRQLKRHQESVRSAKPCLSIQKPLYSMSSNLPPIANRSHQKEVEKREVTRINRILLRKILAIGHRRAPQPVRRPLPKIVPAKKQKDFEDGLLKQQSRIHEIKTSMPVAQMEKDFRRQEGYKQFARKHHPPPMSCPVKRPPRDRHKPMVCGDGQLRSAARQLLLVFYQREFPSWLPYRAAAPAPHLLIHTPREGMRLDWKPVQGHRRLVMKQLATDNIMMFPLDMGSALPMGSFATSSTLPVPSYASAPTQDTVAPSQAPESDAPLRAEVMKMLDDMQATGEIDEILTARERADIAGTDDLGPDDRGPPGEISIPADERGPTDDRGPDVIARSEADREQEERVAREQAAIFLYDVYQRLVPPDSRLMSTPTTIVESPPSTPDGMARRVVNDAIDTVLAIFFSQ